MIKTRLVRRDGNPPVVKALAIDTNFDAVDWSKCAMLLFLTFSCLNDSLKFRIGKVNFAINAASVPGEATDIRTPGSRRAPESHRGSPAARADKPFQINPVTLNKSANLFNTSVNCGSTSASLSVDIDANVAVQPALTLSVDGTFIPPRVCPMPVYPL